MTSKELLKQMSTEDVQDMYLKLCNSELAVLYPDMISTIETELNWRST